MNRYKKLMAEMTIEEMAEMRITKSKVYPEHYYNESEAYIMYEGDFEGGTADEGEAIDLEIAWLEEEAEIEHIPTEDELAKISKAVKNIFEKASDDFGTLVEVVGAYIGRVVQESDENRRS